MSSPFTQYTDRDVVELIEAYPFAWIVTCSGGFDAFPMPLLVETDAAGRPWSLLGHIPRNNPLVDRMREQPRTLFLFSGPHGYISPAFVSTRPDWAPTWNYAVARIEADVTLDDVFTDEALQKLVDHMERKQSRPWSTAAMGARYDQLRRHVIGFKASIRAVDARFKLGQDERPDVFESIITYLAGGELADWMHRFREGQTR